MLTLLLRVRYGKNANLVDRATEFLLGTIVCFAGWTQNEIYVSFVSIFCCAIFAALTIKKEWAQYANPPISATKRQLRISFFFSFLLSFPFISVLASCFFLKTATPVFITVICLTVIAFLWNVRERKSALVTNQFKSTTMIHVGETRLAQLFEMDLARRSRFPSRKLLLPILTFAIEALLATLGIYASNIFVSGIVWPALSGIAYALGKWVAYRPYEDLPLYNVLPEKMKSMWRCAPAQTTCALLIGIISVIQLETFGMITAIILLIFFSALYSRFIPVHPEFSSPLHATLQVPTRSILPELFFLVFSFSMYLTILALAL